MIWNGHTETKVEIETCSSQKNISVILFQVFQMLGKAGVNFMIYNLQQYAFVNNLCLDVSSLNFDLYVL